MPKITIDKERFEVKVGGKEVRLSPKEFDLLAALAAAGDKCVTREYLLMTLWPDGHVDTRSIDQHVSRIRKKIKAPVIRTVPTRGYRYMGDALQS